MGLQNSSIFNLSQFCSLYSLVNLSLSCQSILVNLRYSWQWPAASIFRLILIDLEPLPGWMKDWSDIQFDFMVCTFANEICTFWSMSNLSYICTILKTIMIFEYHHYDYIIMISFKILLNMIKKIFIECCVLHILSDVCLGWIGLRPRLGLGWVFWVY